MLKFLIDECLSPDLVATAIDAGFPESSHVVWQGKAGWQDWELKTFILDGDWTFVTRNSADFRGLTENPGTKGQYADVTIHAGLICLNGPVGMRSPIHCELFQAALEELAGDEHLINGLYSVTAYPFPSTSASHPSTVAAAHPPPVRRATELLGNFADSHSAAHYQHKWLAFTPLPFLPGQPCLGYF